MGRSLEQGFIIFSSLPIPSPPVGWEESLVEAWLPHLGRGVALLLREDGHAERHQDDEDGCVGVHCDLVSVGAGQLTGCVCYLTGGVSCLNNLAFYSYPNLL